MGNHLFLHTALTLVLMSSYPSVMTLYIMAVASEIPLLIPGASLQSTYLRGSLMGTGPLGLGAFFLHPHQLRTTVHLLYHRTSELDPKMTRQNQRMGKGFNSYPPARGSI